MHKRVDSILADRSIRRQFCYGPEAVFGFAPIGDIATAAAARLYCSRSSVEIGGAMLHHASFGVSNIQASSRFYDAVLSALGYSRVWEDLTLGSDDQAIGYGPPNSGDKFAIKLRADAAISGGSGHHLAFDAPSRQAVNAFHIAALVHGGVDNGGPGLRPHYGQYYYAAFVIDPDGNHIEAVCKSPA